MAHLSVHSVQSEIGKRISQKIGVKDTNLHRLLSKTRGHLPRGFEKDVSYLFDAEERTKHPKRRGQVDMRKLEAVRRTCLAKLEAVDIERDRMRGRALWLAEFAARMLIFVTLFTVLLYWLDII